MVLERILVTERVRRRMARSGDFAVPVVQEREGVPKDGPYVATGTRGQLILTRPSRDNLVRFGFFEVPLEEEDAFFSKALTLLWDLSVEHDWGNRCDSVPNGLARMVQCGYEPKSVVLPFQLLKYACGSEITLEEAEKLMRYQGYVAEIDEVKYLVADINSGKAIIMAAPPLVGYYTRADNHIGVLLQRADRALMLVRYV
jgi:hypothetical protein